MVVSVHRGQHLVVPVVNATFVQAAVTSSFQTEGRKLALYTMFVTQRRMSNHAEHQQKAELSDSPIECSVCILLRFCKS